MIRRKTLFLLTAAAVAAAMTGCGNKNAAETSAAATTAAAQTEASSEPETKAPEEAGDQADLVVAGGDGAGMIAAIQAVKEGLDPSKVVIVEKTGELGSDLDSMENFMNASNTDEQYDGDIEDSYELYLGDITKSGNNKNDVNLAGFVAESSEESLTWLRDMGIEMDGVTKENGSSVARSYTAANGDLSKLLKAKLLEQVETLKIKVETDSAVDEVLFNEDGSVSGIKVSGTEGQKTIGCAAILITEPDLLTLLKDTSSVFTTDEAGGITGLLVDNCAEVVSQDGEFLPGLYAAGRVIAPAVSGEAALPGNNMTAMILFGITAGSESEIYVSDLR